MPEPAGLACDAIPPGGPERINVGSGAHRPTARVATCEPSDNAHLEQLETNAACRPAPDDQAMLANAIDLLKLSARSMHRILRVARSIADLAGSVDILGMHVSEAIGYRRGERKNAS